MTSESEPTPNEPCRTFDRCSAPVRPIGVSIGDVVDASSQWSVCDDISHYKRWTAGGVCLLLRLFQFSRGLCDVAKPELIRGVMERFGCSSPANQTLP
ncbi:hypothetical protein DPX16_2559 [Anabarilius grahami]|uniref:Uncharacterized protein n=1 Tax=Anabarilius grahami TaxID=495550 RepID=A0A3N0XDZ9_ANAGA|nr:hypothetical protein DPX16_2559 [Anabarilius grahami]